MSPQFHVLFDDLFETVVCNGDNDGLFEQKCELYIENEFDTGNVLIYKPPPLHKVWLDEAGSRQRKEDILRQCCWNEDLMHARC